MDSGRLVRLFLGLALFFPLATLAQEPAAAPLLLAHLRALDRSSLAAPTAREANGATEENQRLASLSLAPLRWSREQGAAVVVGALTLPAPPAPASPLLLVRNEEPRLVPVTPLPRTLPSTMFRHSRVRGPFEQVYPRIW